MKTVIRLLRFVACGTLRATASAIHADDPFRKFVGSLSMNITRDSKSLCAIIAATATALAPVCAGTPATIASGLSTPMKVAVTSQSNLLVAEAGTGTNAGRLSLVESSTGNRRTLVDGLPSGFAGPVNGQSGPSGLALDGRTLYLTIGTGDAMAAGNPGLVPNPRPSSPLLCSVLAIVFSADPEKTTAAWTLSSADHTALKSGSRLTRDSGAGDPMTIELVADLPDYVPEPTASQPNNVRPANPWGVAVLGERLFVIDASLNSLIVVDPVSHAVRTLTTFAPLPNTRGTGPSVVEAVPDGIRAYGNQILVTLLTGFPFPVGGAQVRLVDPDTGANSPFITGLTSAIDVLPLPGGGFLTLEYSADMLAGAAATSSGRLQLFAAPNTAPIVVGNSFSTPTGLALDQRSGSVFITEISTGRIVKVPPWSAASVASVTSPPFSNLSVRGNAGAGNETLIAGFTIEATAKQVLVRGVGPRLSTFGITGALADPKIVVYNSAGRAIAENDDWSATSEAETALVAGAAAKVGAFSLAAGSKDAALLRTLAPGTYTVHVSGVGGAAGIAIVEVFHVP
jgi:hypothetical protein